MTEADPVPAEQAKAIDGYIEFFETLRPDTLDRLADIVTPDVRFTDPFNDVTGVEAMHAIFHRMFGELDNPAFKVTYRAKDTRDDAVWLLCWRLTGKLRALSNRDWDVAGMSEIRLAADGRVAAHIDHWDAGRNFYELLPVVGSVIRLLRRRVGRN